jgi:hypothetical protein
MVTVPVDVVFFSLGPFFLITLILVENLCFAAVGVIVAEDTVAPGSFHKPIALGQEHVLGLEPLEFLKLLADLFDFLTNFFRGPEGAFLLSRAVELLFSRIESGNLFSTCVLVRLSLGLEHRKLALLDHRRHVRSLL